MMRELPFPWSLLLSDLNLGKKTGTEVWAGVPVIAEGLNQPSWP